MIEQLMLQRECKLVKELLWNLAELGFEEMPAEQFVVTLQVVNKKAKKIRSLINGQVPEAIHLVTRETMREVRERYGIEEMM
jgi:hypothetical protein